MPDHKYDTNNPVVREPNFDPTQRYSRQAIDSGLRRFWAICARNYSAWPILVITGVVVPGGLSWFLYHRLTDTPDVIYPHKESEPWNRFEHRHAKLNRVDMEPVLSEHPRPRFDYKYEPTDKTSKK